MLDTHAFLWWLTAAPALSREAAQAIADAASVVHVSAATIWEIAIKAGLRRIDLGDADLEREIGANDFVELPIRSRHAVVAGKLPRHHEDPFDRILVAQATVEDLVIVTHDRAFRAYRVSLLPT